MSGSEVSTATSDEQRREANTALGTGVGIGAFGVASAALLGAVCPMCVIAAPALIGYGLYQRVQNARADRKSCSSPLQPEEKVRC
jgi:hypothetical protein